MVISGSNIGLSCAIDIAECPVHFSVVALKTPNIISSMGHGKKILSVNDVGGHVQVTLCDQTCLAVLQTSGTLGDWTHRTALRLKRIFSSFKSEA